MEQTDSTQNIESGLRIGVGTGALGEFLGALRYFLLHFPRRTVAVFAAALALAITEMVSASMLLPLMTLGVGAEVNAPLIGYVKSTLEFAGIDYQFEWVFFVFIGAFTVKVVLELLFGLFIDNSSVLISQNFRARIIEGLRKVSWSYFTDRPHGLVVNLMTQEIDRATGIFNQLQQVAVSSFMFTVYIAIGLSVSYELLIAAALMGVAGVLVARPMIQMARRAGVGQIENLRNLASDLAQGMQAFKAFKAMARERELLGTLADANAAFVAASRLKVRAQRFLAASQHMVLILSVSAGFFVARDVLGIGFLELGFMAVVLMRLNSNLANLLKKFQAIANSHYALVRYSEFEDDFARNTEVRKGQKRPVFPAAIRLEGINFGHGTRQILDGVSLVIEAKGLTTIVGPSGSGKTKIIDLICGFYRPDEGRILIGKDDLADINVRAWRQMIGYVTQEPNLLHDSIARNVAAFDPSITESQIVDALKAAGAWSFVSNLPEGLNTNAGVSGLRLSGGERQRIAVARALAQKPKLLILDEPTSSVDAQAAADLIATIRDISARMPVLAISHQSELADVSDVLYRIENGRITHLRSDSRIHSRAKRQKSMV